MLLTERLKDDTSVESLYKMKHFKNDDCCSQNDLYAEWNKVESGECSLFDLDTFVQQEHSPKQAG